MPAAPKDTLKQKTRRFLPYFIFACGLIAFAILFYHFVSSHHVLQGKMQALINIMNPILIGIILTFFLTPAVAATERYFLRFQSWLRRQKRIPVPRSYRTSVKEHRGFIRFVSMLLCYILIFGALVLSLVYIIPQLIESLTAIVNLVSSSITLLITTANNLLSSWEELPLNAYISSDDILRVLNEQLFTFSTALQNFITALVPKLSSTLFSFASGFISFLVGIIISVYLIADRERAIRNLKRIVYALIPKRYSMSLINLCSETVEIFRTFFVGKIIDSLIIGIICYFLMLILRLDYPVLIACIVGVTNVIPYFGPFIGAIPSALILLMASPMQSLIFAIMILILQQFDGNILGPYILGGTLGIKPFWIIFAVTVGNGFFGLFGMIIGVPLFTVVYTLLRRYLVRRMEQKNIAGTPALEALEQERRLTAPKPVRNRNRNKKEKKSANS